jgi:hypothetical protein
VSARWPIPQAENTKPLSLTTSGALPLKDRQGRDVILFESVWELRYVSEANPHYTFVDTR